MTILYDCIVVANGSFPQTTYPLELLKSSPAIIACDGAVKNLYQRGLEPKAIVGDLDSIPPSLLQLYANRIHVVADQEINDLTKAIRFASQSGYRKILILAATGLREDHTLGNISLLVDYVSMFDHIEMLSDYGTFIPIVGSTTLKSFPGQQISIFSVFPEGTITSQGLKWPINNRQLTAWWQGTLNEALEEEFTIVLSAGSKAIIYLENPT